MDDTTTPEPADEEAVLLAALTDRQRLFADFFLGKARFNQREAAELAGYSDPIAHAHKVRNHPSVAAYIDYRLNLETLTSKEILARLGEQARLDVTDFYDMGDKNIPIFNPAKAMERGVIHLIAGFEYSKNGDLIVKFPDKQAALVHLGRHQKLFTDRVEVDLPDDLSDYTDDELRAIAAGKSVRRTRTA